MICATQGELQRPGARIGRGGVRLVDHPDRARVGCQPLPVLTTPTEKTPPATSHDAGLIRAMPARVNGFQAGAKMREAVGQAIAVANG